MSGYAKMYFVYAAYMADEATVNINLRLGVKELEAIDEARPSTVPRTHWIRGAIRQRLGLWERDDARGRGDSGRED
jgi:hypothetical protein